MKIYFDDPEYDGQFLRTLDHAPLGAQIGEAWTVAAQIRVGDAASWYNALSCYADRLYDLAVKLHAGGDRVSACNAFLRAPLSAVPFARQARIAASVPSAFL